MTMDLSGLEFTIHDNTIPSDVARQVACLCKDALGELQESEFYWKLENQRAVCLASCFHREQLVGFKLGYARNRIKFYSWLGAVHSNLRRRGIARELMRRQHIWCKEQGFEIIETQTINRWKEMLILNLKEGFEIKGTYGSDDFGLKIILEKRL